MVATGDRQTQKDPAHEEARRGLYLNFEFVGMSSKSFHLLSLVKWLTIGENLIKILTGANTMTARTVKGLVRALKSFRFSMPFLFGFQKNLTRE